MKVFTNGNRYAYIEKYEEKLNQPYDYVNNGLLKHLMSQRVILTDNEITKFILRVFEKEITSLLKVVDYLANFKNPYFKNR